MPHITLERHLPFTKAQLMDLALDIERYHEFVPFCESCTIRERAERAGRQYMVAAMTVGVSIFNETFVSRIVPNHEAGSIDVTGLDGPLKTLFNQWKFEELEADKGTTIHFSVEFEFKSRILAASAHNRVEAVCDSILNAFIKRAHQLYGS